MISDGLLPTITTAIGLGQVSGVFNDIQAFLTANLLGSDLGVAALSDMTLDIPF